jgi:hypothetical protein
MPKRRGKPRRGWRGRFLKALRPHRNARAEAAGVHRATAYRHRAADPEFAACWGAALATPDPDPVPAGKPIAEWTDRQIMAALMRRRPWKFCDRYTAPAPDLVRPPAEVEMRQITHVKKTRPRAGVRVA